MFTEINAQLLKDNSGSVEPQKRWFRDADSECDLFVWMDKNRQMTKFQFWLKDLLLEWDRHDGLKTGKLDDESGSFHSIQTPVYSYHLTMHKGILPLVYRLLKQEVSRQESNRLFRKILATLEDSYIQARYPGKNS
ncbi:MAG TPA: hypothetical protein EYP36_11900 [Calditrichaeota bacterium]|nr:hypothetical protein [Calditrichota bacterium]